MGMQHGRMTQMIDVTLKLPEPLLRAARDVAAERDVTVGHLLRQGLAAEIRRAPRPATSPDRAEERRLALLRAQYADDIARATDWHDLQRRLRDKAVTLREAGGGLALFSWPAGARICKASDLGASLQVLARRFRAPFPGDRSGNPWHRTQTTRPDEEDVVI